MNGSWCIVFILIHKYAFFVCYNMSMDARSKIILYILLVMIAILTFNIRNAREIKKFVESILQENDTKKSYEMAFHESYNTRKSYERTSDDTKKSYENASHSTTKSYLTEEQKAFVRKYVSSRNYNYAKRKLEQLGFKNVRIHKIREIIIIEFEGGKEVIPMTPST